MKMKMKRILASIFACVVSLTAFASCKDGTDSSSNDATNTETSAKNPISVDTEHYQDKTLHKVKVTETARPLRRRTNGSKSGVCVNIQTSCGRNGL